jgi:hypothetical protein
LQSCNVVMQDKYQLNIWIFDRNSPGISIGDFRRFGRNFSTDNLSCKNTCKGEKDGLPGKVHLDNGEGSPDTGFNILDDKETTLQSDKLSLALVRVLGLAQLRYE